MPRRLPTVAVVTGATSGIGRATALAFARRGAAIVLAARREEALEAAARDCERAGAGARTLAVPTDVTDAAAVEALAARALDAFGRIDVWVNSAAVSLFGRLEESPPEAFDQVIRVNVSGCANGCRAAIRQFREQGHGRLINVASMVGAAGQPYVSAYVASKWAVRGLTESLRMELADAPDIAVSAVLPASIDTPLFQHAANFTGRPVKALSPVYPPEQVAEAIVGVARRPRREVFVGNAGRTMALVRSLAPPLGERLMRETVEKDHFADGPPAPASRGNLFEPAGGAGAVRGGWIERERARRTPRLPIAAAGAAVAVALGLVVAARSRRRGPSTRRLARA